MRSGDLREAEPPRATPQPVLPLRPFALAGQLVLFWIALPLGAWFGARALDGYLGWTLTPLWPGWIPVGGGAGLLFWFLSAQFRGGASLPLAPLPAPRFAVAGPYRLVRHPLYLGAWLLIIGLGLALGSRSLWAIVAPGLLPPWLLLTLLAERRLVRRYGRHYRRYQRQVGLLTPRLSLYGPLKGINVLGILPIRVTGREHLPAKGPAVLVANHASYLDPAFVAFASRRQVHFMATAELYRRAKGRWICERLGALPLRRFRPDPAALREAEALLAAGRVVGLFPEGERSPLGRLQAPLPGAVAWLASLPCPVIPLGISGCYDVGPRWSDALRRRPVRVRLGPPLQLSGDDPGQAIGAGLAALLEADPQPVHLDGLDRALLARVIWRCPRCLAEAGFRPAELRCTVCGAEAQPTADGRLVDDQGRVCSLGEWAGPVWAAEETEPLAIRARAAHCRHLFGPLMPFEPLAPDRLSVADDGLRFGELFLPLADILAITTERADTLQVTCAAGMWQFTPDGGSVFRLKNALEAFGRLARGETP